MFTVPTQLADGVPVASERESSSEANTILHLFWKRTIKIGLAKRRIALWEEEWAALQKPFKRKHNRFR